MDAERAQAKAMKTLAAELEEARKAKLKAEQAAASAAASAAALVASSVRFALSVRGSGDVNNGGILGRGRGDCKAWGRMGRASCMFVVCFK